MLSLFNLHPQPGAVLLATGPVRSVAENQAIYLQGEPAEAILKVVSGAVRTCRFMSNGRRQIDAFYEAGDVFGFEASADYSLTAEAVSNCTLVSYRRGGLTSLALHNQVLAEQLHKHSIRNLARAREHVCLLGRFTALEKLAAFLTDAARHSPQCKHVTLVMNRADIADYLGLTVETVSRSLARLQRDRLIAFSSSRHIELTDLPGLRMINA